MSRYWIALGVIAAVFSAAAVAGPSQAVPAGLAVTRPLPYPLAARSPAVVVSPTRTSANTVTYQDSTGENAAAPDITSITVSNTDARQLTFQVNIPNRPTLTQDMVLLLFVDADSNASTGDPSELGADYVLEVFRNQVGLFRWDGTNFTRSAGNPSATTLAFSYSGGLTLTINAAELGNTTAFGFSVIAVSGVTVDSAGNPVFTSAVADIAPAADVGLYAYRVIVATTPPPPRPKPPPPPKPDATWRDAPRLPARIRFVGNSIKHVRLGEKLYDTMQRLQRAGIIRVPRVVAVACWSQSDWLSVTESIGFDGNPRFLSGFWLRRQPRWVHIAPKECGDVQALMLARQSNGQRAYALSTILHERVHAEGIQAEAETNCYGVQLVYDFARELEFPVQKALRLEQLAVRKSRQVAPRGYWNAAKCRDGGAWDLYPQLINLSY